MTREDAIKILNTVLLLGKCDCPKEEIEECLQMAIKALEQESIYNSAESKLKNPKAKTFDILHFVADNAGLSTFEAIEKAYNMGVSEQEQVLDKIRTEILEEKECAYADFERYKVEYLGQDQEDVLDSLPQDDFRYGMERTIEIIDKYKGEDKE